MSIAAKGAQPKPSTRAGSDRYVRFSIELDREILVDIAIEKAKDGGSYKSIINRRLRESYDRETANKRAR